MALNDPEYRRIVFDIFKSYIDERPFKENGLARRLLRDLYALRGDSQDNEDAWRRFATRMRTSPPYAATAHGGKHMLLDADIPDPVEWGP